MEGCGYGALLSTKRMVTSAHLGNPDPNSISSEPDLGEVAFIRAKTRVAQKPEQTTTSKPL